MSSALRLDDPLRLQRLRSIDILDTLAEAHFDGLAELTAKLLRAPVALINFVDDVRVWCKAAWGSERRHYLHHEALCSHALLTGDALVIPDTLADESFRHHISITDERQVRFYIGIVLRTSDGAALGTLCVIDHVARAVDEGDIRTLRQLALQIVAHLEARLPQLRIAALEEQLESAQENRDRFLAMLAHELRAPLAPILTAVQILNRKGITLDQRMWAKTLIYRHVRYMGEIVDHLLSTSLVSFGALELHLEPISVKTLLEHAIEMSQAAILEGQHSFSWRIVGDAPWVSADRTQCPLVISHLLTNAAQYTPAGGAINLTVEETDATVAIRVRDTGIGIAEADMNEIFQIFGQSKQPLDRAKGGMGLGLALSRRLAEWHGGSLSVTSDGPGKGSEFVLALKRTNPPEQAPSVGLKEHEQFVPLDIVIVEDSVDTADALALYYDLSGHNVRVAYRASDAVAMVAQRQPDIILSDIGLPDTDGYELIKRLRELNSLIPTAFIAITGYASEKDRETAFQAGFDAHFSKPVDLEQLDRELSRLQASKSARAASRP
ncbi:PAS/PAC sensor hybrid histidine kinase [Caballeronia sordidicola]|uniref:histidine kinase n=1 Tax=Caballeronia sordidicola TaxID=196367 RepID=A0A158EP63_CABSO|nr:ATP-binding protein [Caballeronia sordidicola]SAL09327.1 PAS/PAC sensor hybrid histidine kinase [Caballeronia sordidicola]